MSSTNLHKWRWRAITVWVILFTAVTTLSMIQTRNNSNDGRSAHHAICALVKDYRHRVKSSEQFVKYHPLGIPGIPIGTIRESIKNQKQTIMTLNRVIRCPEVE